MRGELTLPRIGKTTRHSSHDQSSGSVSVGHRSFLHRATFQTQLGHVITSKIIVSIRSLVLVKEENSDDAHATQLSLRALRRGRAA